MIDKPKIVCLCGSTKFKDLFEKVNRAYTLDGYIVLAPGVFAHSDGIKLTDKEKESLDKLHFHKIDMADEVVILNQDNYVGESTFKEICYIRSIKKPVRHLCEENWMKDVKTKKIRTAAGSPWTALPPVNCKIFPADRGRSDSVFPRPGCPE